MECIVQNSMEQNRRVWNALETTVSYKARARLTPTLTHVVTYELVTSGAEDRAMSGSPAYPNINMHSGCLALRRHTRAHP